MQQGGIGIVERQVVVVAVEGYHGVGRGDDEIDGFARGQEGGYRLGLRTGCPVRAVGSAGGHVVVATELDEQATELLADEAELRLAQEVVLHGEVLPLAVGGHLLRKNIDHPIGLRQIAFDGRGNAFKPLIGQPLVAVSQMDNAAVEEAIFPDVVLHDAVVAVGIDANVVLMGEAVVHDASEDAVGTRRTGNAMDDAVGLFVVEPRPVVDVVVGGFRRGQEGEVAHDEAVVLDDETAVAFYVGLYGQERRIVVGPLAGVARTAHDGLCFSEDSHDGFAVIW